MNLKSLVMLFSTLFGGREKTNEGRYTQPETAKSSFIGGDAKFQSPQAYIPPSPVKYPDDYCVHFNENDEFDFVVIGAGPGGSTVARRLAEDPKVRVLLMEAGGDPPPQSDIPSKFGQVDYGEKWHFGNCVDTEENKRKCSYAPAKLLGGCTVTNGMIYIRGNRKDYDDWEKTGCKGWSYNDVLPYFKKSETYSQYPLLSTKKLKKSEDLNVAGEKYHGTEGPMHVSAFKEDPFVNEIREAMIKAHIENGIKFNPDVNGANQMGVTIFGGMVDKLGYRNSAARVFLLNIPDNLKVCKYSTAMTLELNVKTVTGVNFQYNGTGEVKNYKAKARREYIISAGSYNSAPLLERSGIGRKDVLEKLGIEVKHELPGVGENFQDHFTSGTLFAADFKSEAAGNPLTIPMATFGSFINSSHPKSSVPDFEILGIVLKPEVTEALGLGKDTSEQFKAIQAGDKTVFFFYPVHLRHPNPGSIHITQTEDPTVSPKIITNQLTTQLEKQRIVKATHIIRKVMSSESLKPFKVEPLVVEGCKKHDFNSAEEILCHMNLLSSSIYHACGATSMGAKDNPNTVVDPELRLKGIENVRIVDGGVIPSVPRGHTTAATMMIAEKAADMIKKSWK